MAANEFERMELYLQNLEALRYYPQVKEERDSLTVEASKLKEKVTQLKNQLKTETATKNELSSRLTKTVDEAKELTNRLNEAEKELSSLREFKAKFPEGGEITLEETRALFLDAEKGEIERRAQERFQGLEADVQAQMPALVKENLRQVLNSSEWPPEITEIIHSKARQIADGILGTKEQWPEWFKSYYLEQVNASVSQQLDAEFERRVQTEAEKRLELLKAGEWKGYAAAKVMALTASLKNLLKELQGKWWFACDRCGRKLAIDLNPSDIGLLLRGGTIDIVCNTCLDPAPLPFIFSTVQHRIGNLSLESLLKLYMGNAPR